MQVISLWSVFELELVRQAIADTFRRGKNMFQYLQLNSALFHCFSHDRCSEAIPIPIKAGLNELPPPALANRSTAQPRVPSPRFSVSTTRRSVPTAAEKTEYGARYTSQAPKRIHDTHSISSILDEEKANADPPELNTSMESNSPRESAVPANWSNVMQQSVRMDRRAITELSNVAQSGS